MRDFLLSTMKDAYYSVRSWSYKKKVFIALLLIIAATIIIVYRPSTVALREMAQSYGKASIIIYFLLYISITQLPIPRTVFTLTAGILFGPLVGFLLVISATTLSALISFSIVRQLLGEWMKPRLKHPAVAGINERLYKRGWLAILSLRMIAAVPFSILNYAAALSSIPLLPFVIATALGSAPGSLATVFLGDSMTGQINLPMLSVSLILFILGTSGLILDKKMRVTNTF